MQEMKLRPKKRKLENYICDDDNNNEDDDGCYASHFSHLQRGKCNQFFRARDGIRAMPSSSLIQSMNALFIVSIFSHFAFALVLFHSISFVVIVFNSIITFRTIGSASFAYAIGQIWLEWRKQKHTHMYM